MNNIPQYLTDKDTAARYAVSRGTIWRWIREGNFPQPVKFGAASTRWSLADLLAWESERHIQSKREAA